MLLLTVPCRLLIICLDMADLLASLCVGFYCVSVTFPYGVPGQVWYLIVLVPDICLLLYLVDSVIYTG